MRFFRFFTALILFVACENPKPQQDELPYIGKHEPAQSSEKGVITYHTVPDFSFLTQDSTVLESKAIEGRIWVAKFFFTTCPTICPPMTSAMKEVYEEVTTFSDDVVFLSFSIDPTKDTPSQLTEYIATHGITTDNWYFLTGEDEEEVHQLGVEGFYIHAQADPYALGGYAHSPNFVLVDQNRNIRGIYDGLNKEDRNALIKAIKILLEDGK